MKIADARDFVIGKFYAKVIFESREQFQSLQAVDPQFLEEIIIGLKRGARNLEVRGGEIQNFIRCLFEGFHKLGIKLTAPFYRKTTLAFGYGKYGCAPVSSTNLRKPCITAGRAKS